MSRVRPKSHGCGELQLSLLAEIALPLLALRCELEAEIWYPTLDLPVADKCLARHVQSYLRQTARSAWC